MQCDCKDVKADPLNYKEYAKLAGGFYPSKFDAAKWVAAIKASGAKYICFTTRHQRGRKDNKRRQV